MQKVRLFLAKLTGYIAILSWLTLLTFIFLYLILNKFCVTLEILTISLAFSILITIFEG